MIEVIKKHPIGTWALIGALLFGGLGTMQSYSSRCLQYTISSTASDYFINLDGHAHLVEFENDTAGDTSGTEGEVSTCMTDDANTCKPRDWDYDYDGVPDGNVLNGIEDPQQRRVVVAAQVLYFNTTAYSQPGLLSLCPVKYLTR